MYDSQINVQYLQMWKRALLEESWVTYSCWVFESPRLDNWHHTTSHMLQWESDQLSYHPLVLLLDTSSSQPLHPQVKIICFCTWWMYAPPVPDPPLTNAWRACFGGLREVAIFCFPLVAAAQPWQPVPIKNIFILLVTRSWKDDLWSKNFPFWDWDLTAKPLLQSPGLLQGAS